MDGRSLYQLGCRFPKEIIPLGLWADVPKVDRDKKYCWTGEYWYFLPGSSVPRMYVKLHLPDGSVLEIRKLTDEADLPDPVPDRKLTQAQLEYLDHCAQLIGNLSTTPEECSSLVPQWMETHTNGEKMWFQLRGIRLDPVADQGTAPPRWLAEYWTAERVRSVLEGKYGEKEYLRPTQEGQKLWYFAKEPDFIKACIPKELEPGLPRLSWSGEYGWIAEYWYYYVNAAVGLIYFPEPKYYLRFSLSKGQLLEVKSLTGEVQFQKSWLDVWAPWIYERELDYLARCERLMSQENPEQSQIDELQGLWLEAHPREFALVLANSSGLREAAVRWILSPERTPNKDLIRPLWFGEMIKGIRLGDPETAELCVKNAAEFGSGAST